MMGAELLALAASHRAYRPRDAFDAAPVVNLAGRRFVVELPVRSSADGKCNSLPFWRYDAVHEKLSVIFFGGRRLRSSLKGHDGKHNPIFNEMPDMANAATVNCTKVSKGYWTLTNAFGAATSVERVEETVVEIVAARPPLAASLGYFLMAERHVDPEDARRITKTLSVRFEGRLGDWGNGSSLACGIAQSTPDMTSIWDTTVNTCMYVGMIERVSVFDTATGSVLFEKDIEWFDDTGRNKVGF